MLFRSGVSHEMDYEAFYAERGIDHLTDVWGIEHDFSEPMMILTESMYKGYKYFKHYDDVRDWEHYWDIFEKYDHCIGIAKWNFTADEEPAYTRGNYQILQDLKLDYNDFRHLADYSMDWAHNIINGDRIYTYCFLGLMADNSNPQNNYTKSILKNPEMIKEDSVRKYVSHLLNKKCDQLKCGKIWLKGSFKFMAPDLIMLMEHIAGLDTVGCLGADEFYSHDRYGTISGERLIERNPHLSHSEHLILNGVDNEVINTYCGHLDNVCMLNSKSILCQRLNGADFDGDLCLVIDNDIMMKGVDRDAAVVMDVEDKITALAEEDTPDARVALVLRTVNSLIGETSNCATGYHNKMPKSDDVKRKYDSYVALLSIINGKAIDYAKTGVLYNIPKHIAKYSKPLPYFMRYASDYYKGLNKFSHSNSNMNRMCRDIEHWRKQYQYHVGRNFDYHIMIDSGTGVDPETYDRIEAVYLRFCKEMIELSRDQKNVRKYGADDMSKFDSKNFMINWEYYYNKYRHEIDYICDDQKMVANIVVDLCYRKYPRKNKKFIWIVAAKGVLENLQQVDFDLPVHDNNGECEYLGRRYSLSPIQIKTEINEEDDLQ